MTRVKMSSAAGGALGVRAPAHIAGQRQRFQQRHQVHRAALQRGALGQGHAVDHEVGVAVESTLDRLAERQEAGAQLIGERSQAKIEARRLELLVAERRRTP